MNAGAYGSEIKNILKSARVMTNEGEVLELSVDELELGYRTSFLSPGLYGAGGILSAGTEGPGSREAQMRTAARRRGRNSLWNIPAQASTFKRPQGYFAGKLIEDAGLGDTAWAVPGYRRSTAVL